jgi:hypothetical protein
MTPVATAPITPSSSMPSASAVPRGAIAPLPAEKMIVFEDVSKFYGEMLGVNA